MAEASLAEDLVECHAVFASEVVRALSEFYAVPVDLPLISGEVKYLTNEICWGIISVSYILHQKHCEVFNSLKKGLKNEHYFRRCCMSIPTKRNDRFFFNFFRRVSMIFEMAVFCYRNNDNFIATAQTCIARFKYKEHFKSAGSWKKLDTIGSFLAIHIKPFRPLMMETIRQCCSTYFLSTGKTVKIRLGDENSREDLTKDTISSAVERDREIESAIALVFTGYVPNVGDLDSIEGKIKLIILYLSTILPRKIEEHLQLPEVSGIENYSRAESPIPERSSTRRERSSALFYEQLSEEISLCLTEKICIKSRFDELSSFVKETSAFFQGTSASNERKNGTENSTYDENFMALLLYDLHVRAGTFKFNPSYLSNSESRGTESRCANNSLEGDAAQNNIPLSESSDSLTMNIKSEDKSEVKNNNLSLAIPRGSSTAASFATKDSNSSSEANNEGQLTSNKSSKSSETAVKPNNSNSNNSNPQPHKTGRRKKSKK